MPLLVTSPTELTTAATDAVLALAAGLSAVLMSKTPPSLRQHLWQALFCSLFLGSALGAAAHGLVLEPSVSERLWHPIYFFLGLTLTLLALVAVHDGWEPGQARRLLPVLLPLPFAVVFVTWLGGGRFVWFVLFEAAMMLFVLSVYIRLVLSDAGRGFRAILGGVVVSIAAAALQASGPYSFRLIWTFDHNGLFHLVQLPGIVLFYRGASAPERRESRPPA